MEFSDIDRHDTDGSPVAGQAAVVSRLFYLVVEREREKKRSLNS